jgi:hypothetical protein
MKVLVILFSLFCLIGCKTLSLNSSGKIKETGAFGETVVNSVGNAKDPATLDRQEVEVTLNHKKGDFLVLDINEDSGLVKEILKIDEKTIEKISDEEKSPQKIEAQKKDIRVTYYPSNDSVTKIKGVDVKASTGNSRKDDAAITTAVLRNSKTIQYVGIALVVAGAAMFGFLKLSGQGGIVATVGVGLIILQSTLANPIWSWVMVIALVVIPGIWLWNSYKRGAFNKNLVKAIEKAKEGSPEIKKKIEDALSKEMEEKDKKEVKKIKKNF